jgi:hypothetical protein
VIESREPKVDNRYIGWLQTQGIRLFRLNDTYWRLYNAALIPASPTPHFLTVPKSGAKSLLQESGAWLLRYTSDPTEIETPWWHIVCDSFDSAKLSSKLRNQIRHGQRNCSVERIDARWFSEHGYAVYLTAHDRYANATPLAKEKFRNNVLAGIGGPFEYWGVFVGTSLAAYCQCTVEENNVDTTATRFDPNYLKLHISHAMISTLIDHYVMRGGKALSNGERSVSHDTNFQDFLLKFGFRKIFCRLNIIYRPWLQSAIQLAFPFRRVATRFPDRAFLHKLRALLLQEQIRRLCG